MQNPQFLDSYTALIRKREALGKPWGFKALDVAFVLFNFMTIVQSPVKAIRTRRPFDEAVDSWVARSGKGLDESINHLARYDYMIDATLKHYPIEVLEVEYHALLKSPEAEVKRIADFVGMPVNQEAVAFVDPSLCRFGGK